MYCCMITGNVSLLSTKLYLYSVDNWHHLRHVFVRQRAGNDGRIQATASRLNRRHPTNTFLSPIINCCLFVFHSYTITRCVILSTLHSADSV